MKTTTKTAMKTALETANEAWTDMEIGRKIERLLLGLMIGEEEEAKQITIMERTYVLEASLCPYRVTITPCDN